MGVLAGRRAGVVIGLGLIASLALAGCSGGTPADSGGAGTGGAGGTGRAGSGGAGAISPAAAKSLVAHIMTTNNTANVKLDSSLLASYETETAFTIDDAGYRADHVAEQVSGAKVPYTPFTLDVTEIGTAATDGSGGGGGSGGAPTFLAGGVSKTLGTTSPSKGDAPTCGSILGFERFGSTWKIAEEPAVPVSLLPHLDLGSGGYDASPSASAEAKARQVPAKAVAALQAEETSGKAGPFGNGIFDRACGEMINPREDVLGAERSGFGDRDVFATLASADTMTFALTHGDTFVLFPISDENNLVAGAANDPIPWSHASLSRDPGAAYTYELAAGNYSQVNEYSDMQLAAVMTPSGSFSIVGAYSGVIRISGEKVKSSSPSGTLTGFASSRP